MKGTGNAFAVYFTAVAQVRAQVRTIRFQYFCLTVFSTKQHHLLVEEVQRFDITWIEVFRVSDCVPTERYR